MKRLVLTATLLACASLSACAAGVYGYYAPVGPPPVRREIVVASPGPGYVWVPGYYSYAGGYAWVPGRWVLPPRPRAVWVTPRWERAGGRRGFRNGYWR